MSTSPMLLLDKEYKSHEAAAFLSLPTSIVDDFLDIGILPVARKEKGAYLVTGLALQDYLDERARRRETLEALLAQSPKVASNHI